MLEYINLSLIFKALYNHNIKCLVIFLIIIIMIQHMNSTMASRLVTINKLCYICKRDNVYLMTVNVKR